jgi:hypothetical protein
VGLKLNGTHQLLAYDNDDDDDDDDDVNLQGDNHKNCKEKHRNI